MYLRQNGDRQICWHRKRERESKIEREKGREYECMCVLVCTCGTTVINTFAHKQSVRKRERERA